MRYSLTLLLCLCSLLVQANPARHSDLPMSQHNFQDYVPRNADRFRQDEDDFDPNLIRLMIDQHLLTAMYPLMDTFKLAHPEARFRIHTGTVQDLAVLMEEFVLFDLVITAHLRDALQLVHTGKAREARLLAVGRLALWAPRETARSLRVLDLQNGRILLHPLGSPYADAARDVLNFHQRQNDQARLHNIGMDEDLIELLQQQQAPAGFVAYHYLVQKNLHNRRDVLLIPGEQHAAITHGISLMQEGKDRALIQDFWAFLDTPQARQLLRDQGFD